MDLFFFVIEKVSKRKKQVENCINYGEPNVPETDHVDINHSPQSDSDSEYTPDSDSELFPDDITSS